MNETLKLLVVDDEILARKRIIRLISEIKPTAKIFEASSGKESISMIINENPHIVFLDIQMTDMTGFDVLQGINRDKWPVIIFVTAFDHFAVQAFEVQAIDFLLKPYKKERFESALKRGLEKLDSDRNSNYQKSLSNLMSLISNNTESQAHKQYLDRLVLNLKKRYYFVETHQIKYICSSAYYAEIFTLDSKKHIYRISLSELIEKLNPDSFIRVNRSSIIHLGYIKEINNEGMGDFSVAMKDGKQFSLTNNYKQAFMDKINLKNR